MTASQTAARPAVSSPAADKDFRDGLVEAIPYVRAFSRTLCGSKAPADDLAQETLAKAWAARASFQPGTNLKAWLFMIARNQFYSDKRRSWRSSQLDPEVAERTLEAASNPIASLELDEVRRALACLPDDQREALILIGAGGFSYEEAAEIIGVAVGTVKSRVSRARSDLVQIFETGSYDRDGKPVHEAMGSMLRALERLAA